MRIGIFGSAFDPVTLAHLWIAKIVAQRRKLDKIIFVPSSESRIDKGRKLISDIHRWKMLQLAVEEEKLFDLSNIEMIMPEDKRYTFYTMEYFKKRYADDELFFIIGADNLLNIPKWERSEELVRNNKFIVIPRSQYDMQKIIDDNSLLREYKDNFDLIEVGVRLEISSSKIRSEFESGRNPKCMLPPNVYRYIKENNIYEKKGEEKDMSTLQIEMQDEIRKRLCVSPEIDPKDEMRKRVNFLKEYLVKSSMETFVLGISGGQDSALAGKMAQKAIKELRKDSGNEKYKFIAMGLPYGAQPDENDRQIALAYIQPNEYLHVNIKPAVDALVEEVEKAMGRKVSDFTKGNLKARIRMAAQYLIAGDFKGLVVGTDHAAENVTRFYTKFGDGAADILPLYGLTKDQGAELLKADNAPESIYKKVPTANLEDEKPMLPDETALGVLYSEINEYLKGKKIDQKSKERIEHLYTSQEHKAQPPVTMFDDWWR